MQRIFSIAAALECVDPKGYDGWDGACPGCKKDLVTMTEFLLQRGSTVVSGLNDVVTTSWPAEVGAHLLQALNPGDLAFFYWSGHGGQAPDLNGDEEDRLDEYLCAWNGPILDDLIGSWFQLIPRDVLCVTACDTCTSYSMQRGPSESLHRVSSEVAPQTGARFIHMAGCADGSSSYGDENGGQFTRALLKAWKKGMSWKEWFDSASALMPKYQKIKITNVNDAPWNEASFFGQ